MLSLPRHANSGVEHLLRDVKDATISTLTTEVERMAGGLRTLKSRLLEIQQYLELVIAGKLPVNHDIIYNLQVLPHMPCHSFWVIAEMYDQASDRQLPLCFK